ncbi:MAG: metal ABC transporter permease [bacterium]
MGLFASFQFDTPSGPSIVLASLMLFLIGQIPNFRKL